MLDLLFFTLVFIPWLLGLLVGWIAGNNMYVGAFFAIAVFGMAFLFSNNWLINFLPRSTAFPWLAAAMATFWCGSGVYLGLISKSYMGLVQWKGFVFTTVVSAIGLAISSILIEGVYPWIRDNNLLQFRDASLRYFPLLLASAVLALSLGRTLAREVWVSSLKKLVTIVSIVGGISLVIDFIWGGFLQQALWWIPQSEPAPLFGFFIGLVFALQIAFPPYIPGIRLKRPTAPDKDTGVLVAQERESADTLLIRTVGKIVTPPPPKDSLFILVPFSVKIPTGWNVTDQQKDSVAFRLTLAPGRIKGIATIVLRVERYFDVVIDSEGLRKVSHVKLLSEDNEIIGEESGLRHGSISQEYFYKKEIGLGSYFYGKLICFVIADNLFLLRWYASDPAVFRHFQQTFDTFVNTIEFQNQTKESD